MKERPILFNGDMVRALLDGRKTQTRRVIKPQPLGYTGRKFIVPDDSPKAWHDSDDFLSFCPYGQPGDRLWVREAHAIVPRTAYAQSTGVDQVLKPDDDHDAAVFREGWERSQPGPWRPSIHMPRWASRILLEVTAVSVQRLRDITEADAEAEGVDGEAEAAAAGLPWHDNPRRAFRFLWMRINGSESWEANPWVWVVEFKRIDSSEVAA